MHGPFRMLILPALALWLAAGCAVPDDPHAPAPAAPQVDLSPEMWRADYDRFMAAQMVERTEAEVATGYNGAVTVAHNALAARAGLDALKQGGNAMDAALTTAMMQVALTAGGPVSYFGVMELVYYEAATGTVHTMNADWNTVRDELDPLSIPGGRPLTWDGRLPDFEPSGRTALVGGFMKGVGAAHQRFGSLPFSELFSPAIHVATEGFPMPRTTASDLAMRAPDLRRLPETRRTLLKAEGEPYAEGDIFKQPALARTLREIASRGTDYMYGGPLGERMIAAIQADGGRMTLEDLTSYEVIWDEPLVAPLGDYQLHTMPPPIQGGVMMIEGQNLAEASGLIHERHWSQSGASLRKALTIAQMFVLDFLPEERFTDLYPGLERTDSARVTPGFAAELWSRMEEGTLPFTWMEQGPSHSDVVVTADGAGNMVAMSHSINTVFWGKTAIVVDGITISDPASHMQAAVARAGPGQRLPGPAQVGLLMQGARPVLGFGSMGSGMHHRPFQGLMNFARFGMSVDEAINAPDFFVPRPDPATGQLIVRVPEGRFPPEVLEATGLRYEEFSAALVRDNGGGHWVAVSRDPVTGEIRAASHNRDNSGAVAW
jgi:gamma-glutamyltranspeptidase / glutathione hydrolase